MKGSSKSFTRNDQELTDAVNDFDLAAYLAEHYPQSGARAGRTGAIKAAWRGDKNPSASLFKQPGKAMILKDHATGDVWNAYQFLTDVEGLSNAEAMEVLGVETTRREVRPQVIPKPIPTPPAPALTAKPPLAMKGRGLTPKEIAEYGIRDDGGDAIIPIYGVDGQVYNEKRRFLNPSPMKYKYEHEGNGQATWFSPKFLESKAQLWVEGELNALVAHAVLREHGVDIATAGIPGADAHLPDVPLTGRVVYFYSDADTAGNKLRRRFPKWAIGQGARSVTVLDPLQGEDFCDVAGRSRKELFDYLEQARQKEPTTTILDLEVHDGYTLGELREYGRSYITGDMVRPSGYTELDMFTGGFPKSGVIEIGALPSFGKSIMMRDICAFQVTNNQERVMHFTPDQSVPEVAVFLASKLSRIPASALRNRTFSTQLLDEYGSPENIKRAWGEVYDDCLVRLSKNYRMNEASDMREIRGRVERAVDEGFTFFAADYAQILEYYDDRGRQVEGRAISEIKKMTRDFKIPFLVAVQLAKYKFPKGSNRDPLPYPSDIEGSGTYYQAAEQLYMIWDYEVYEREYGGPETPYPSGVENDTGKVRIYVRKNKSGPWGSWRYLRKRPDLGTFINMLEGYDR